MKSNQKNIFGIDLFSGAGGLTLGAKQAGIDVRMSVESDTNAAKTYKVNHQEVIVLNDDICDVSHEKLSFTRDDESSLILFGGPPCQGYSTSNQKTRNKSNPKNWLFEEFVRLTKEIRPEWVLFENVKGIVETEGGFFKKKIFESFMQSGYTCSEYVLSSEKFGVPQCRHRYFLIGSLNGRVPIVKEPKGEIISVKDAIDDLPSLTNGASIDILPYQKEAESNYAKRMRNGLRECSGNLVSKNAQFVVDRYAYIPQGGNWRDIPDEMMQNYKDKSRCHTGVYKRLCEEMPATTIGNYRKSMLIHPWEDRGLSIREAARLQSFPDDYVFCGSLGFQQQQVGNAVPPLLAKAVFEAIIEANG